QPTTSGVLIKERAHVVIYRFGGRGKDKELCIEKEKNSDLLSCVYLLSASVPFL
ncbi:unnamed protein product, partial [Musa acuminata subsp. burmannicoides]